MNILVDYDNIRVQERRKGLVYVVDRVLHAISTVHFGALRRVRMRLYGGWYEGTVLSRRAQDLAAEILTAFPRVNPFGAVTVMTEVELACSLEIEPARHLWHTYRRYGPIDVGCHSPASAGCVRQVCALSAVHVFLARGNCPDPGCVVEPSDLLFRRQQKLVDTMLTADLIFLSRSDPRALSIVSSDDDLWPGVRTALAQGKDVVHVHTLPGHSTSRYYSAGMGSGYTQVGL